MFRRRIVQPIIRLRADCRRKWQVIVAVVRNDTLVVPYAEAVAFVPEDGVPFEEMFASDGVDLS